jgi:CrcB protein
MRTALAIAVFGALGSLSRHGVGVGLQRLLGVRFPYGTFAVNVIGSFLIGLAMAVFATRGELDSRLRIALTVGFLGGFTTYSSFAFETVGLLEKRQAALAAAYVSATLIAAGGACYAGVLVVRWLR